MTMNVQDGYNQWATQYDAVENKTRDLDKQATAQTLEAYAFNQVLELGCGTGKNTMWLLDKGAAVTAVDFSEGMLQTAQEKIQHPRVQFRQADVTQPWPFAAASFDLVTCNLMLEHIEQLEPVFKEAHRVLLPNGLFYICELHPAKQYLGSKARFQHKEELVVLDCFVHHTSDYYKAARQNGFQCIQLEEWFDEPGAPVPRLLAFVFQKT